jgi:hypothetical protein
MKRLEHIRTLRNRASRFQAKTPHGAVMVLAQVAQEKQRLGQERGTWARRIEKIDKRLQEIAAMEDQLSALASLARVTGAHCRHGEEGNAAELVAGLPPGFTEVTVKY